MNIKSSQKLVEEANKTIETLDPKEIKSLIEKDAITLIDVRDIRELWRDGTIENSKHIPRGMLEFWLDPNSSYYQENKIKESKKMVFFCAMGFRSALATKTLVDMGFKNVANAEGGFDALYNAGLKVVQKEKKLFIYSPLLKQTLFYPGPKIICYLRQKLGLQKYLFRKLRLFYFLKCLLLMRKLLLKQKFLD